MLEGSERSISVKAFAGRDNFNLSPESICGFTEKNNQPPSRSHLSRCGGIYSRVPTRELCSWNLEGHRPMYVFTDLSSICDHESNQQVVQGLHWKS